MKTTLNSIIPILVTLFVTVFCFFIFTFPISGISLFFCLFLMLLIPCVLITLFIQIKFNLI